MASIVWSCPSYRDPYLCSKQLLRDHVQSDDAVTAKDWATGNQNHCFVCITPSQQPPIQGCFCSSFTRPKGLPAAMKVTFSEPIVCVGASDTGTDVYEFDVYPREEPEYFPRMLIGGTQTTYHPQTPVSRRSRVPRAWTGGVENDGFTTTYTYNWQMDAPGGSYSEITVQNPLAYIDSPSEKNIARAAINGAACAWYYADMRFSWVYYHDSIYGLERKEWKLTRAPQWSDWVAYTTNNTVYGYLPDTPPNGLPHLADITRVNNSPPPAMLYGDFNISRYWVWQRHYIKNGWGVWGYYYAVPMEEIGVLQPTHLITGGQINIIEGASKSEGTISLNTTNPWDLVYAVGTAGTYDYGYRASTFTSYRPGGFYPGELLVTRSSVSSAPSRAIGPISNPIEYDSVPPDWRKEPVDGYPATFPYQRSSMGLPFNGTTDRYFSNPVSPHPDETMNAWWNGEGFKEGYYFSLGVGGRQFELRMFAKLNPQRFGKVTIRNWAGGRVNRSSLVTTNVGDLFENNNSWEGFASEKPLSWWATNYIEEQGDYEYYVKGNHLGTQLNANGVLGPYKRRTGTPPPTYKILDTILTTSQTVTLATWRSNTIPCNRTGVIELRLVSQPVLQPLAVGEKRIGPTSFPQFAYVDIGDSGVP